MHNTTYSSLTDGAAGGAASSSSPSSVSPHSQPAVELLDEQAAAELLNVAQGTLAVWRSKGSYRLPYIKVGRNVRYNRADLLAWLQARTRNAGAQ